MKTIKLLLAIAATALTIPSAEAADPSTLGCVGLTIGADAMRSLGVNALRLNDGERIGSMDRELDALAQATDLCRRRHGWSEAAAADAGMWTLTSARLDAAAEALERDGVSPMRAGELVGRLSAGEREGLIREPISRSALNALREYAVDAGLPTEGIAAHHLVWFTIMLIKEDRERASFGTH
jgi:hypothetical protein